MTFLKIRKNTFIITLFCLFVYSAVIPMQLSNYVLCIGEDGHVEVEFAINGSCTDIPSHDEDHDGVHSESDDDHCGDCVDLPIFASLNSELYIISNNEVPQLHDHPSSYTLPAYHSSNTLNLSNNHASDIPPFINPTLITLRTVLLLI